MRGYGAEDTVQRADAKNLVSRNGDAMLEWLGSL
jgi:hypothetical protein